jgi:hypothetical protein
VAGLEHNVLTALESVPLDVMRWFVLFCISGYFVHSYFVFSFPRQARQFIDTYSKGSQGKGAAWAAKKYQAITFSQNIFYGNLMMQRRLANLDALSTYVV